MACSNDLRARLISTAEAMLDRLGDNWDRDAETILEFLYECAWDQGFSDCFAAQELDHAAEEGNV